MSPLFRRSPLVLLLLAGCEATVTFEGKGQDEPPVKDPGGGTPPDSGTPQDSQPPEDTAPPEDTSPPEDSTPPVPARPPALTCPPENTRVDMALTPSLTVSVSDPDTAEEDLTLMLSLNGGASRRLSVVGGRATYVLDQPERALGPQSYVVSARDRDANLSTATCIFTGEDHGAPWLTGVTPAAGSVTYDGSVVVAGYAGDSFDTPESLEVTVEVGTDELVVSPAADGYFELDFGPVSSGPRRLTIGVKDPSDNSYTDTWSWTQAAGISIASPNTSDTYYTGDLLEFDADVSDTATVDEVIWTDIDDLGTSTVLSSSTDIDIVSILWESGVHTIELDVTWSDGTSAHDSVSITLYDAATADLDGDLVLAADDCDDRDVTVGAQAMVYQDRDLDGFGWADISDLGCVGEGWVLDASDCLDENAEVYPGAPEVCDYLDNDCDGFEDVGAIDSDAWYLDNDGDGFGTETGVETGCSAPAENYVLDAGDCDDGDSDRNPGVADRCDDPTNDYNCDHSIGLADLDGDGVSACDDCDDTDVNRYPGRGESCAEGDNNCDGDGNETEGADAFTYYADADADGYGDPLVTLRSCTALLPGERERVFDSATRTVSYFIQDNTDCDDTASAVNPGALEVCHATDEVDDDCDGSVDEATSATYGVGTWQADHDGDGYGDPTNEVVACRARTLDIAASASLGIDCDDSSALAHVGLEEVCDGLNNDCDGGTDERLPDLQEPNDNQADATLIAVVADPTSGPSPGTYSLDELQLGDGESDWFYWDAKKDTLEGDPYGATVSVSVSGVAGPFTLNVWEADSVTGTLASASSIASTCDAVSALCSATLDGYPGWDSSAPSDGPIWYSEIVADPGWSCTTDTFSSTYTVSVTY